MAEEKPKSRIGEFFKYISSAISSMFTPLTEEQIQNNKIGSKKFYSNSVVDDNDEAPYVITSKTIKKGLRDMISSLRKSGVSNTTPTKDASSATISQSAKKAETSRSY